MEIKKRRTLIVAAAVAVGVLVLGYYFLSVAGKNDFSDVRAVVAAMERDGIACEELSVSAPDPTPDLVDFGSCQIDGRTVSVHVFKNSDALATHIEGQLAAQGKNPNYFTSLVAGSNWVVDTFSDQTSRRVQRAIGGEIH